MAEIIIICLFIVLWVSSWGRVLWIGFWLVLFEVFCEFKGIFVVLGFDGVWIVFDRFFFVVGGWCWLLTGFFFFLGGCFGFFNRVVLYFERLE